MRNDNDKLHRDGTVTYWSVYHQQWISHAHRVPDEELAARSATERRRIMHHIPRPRDDDDPFR